MDTTWEFQTPQCVDFNNLSPTNDTSADEFLDDDIESDEHWVTAVEDMDVDQAAPPRTPRSLGVGTSRLGAGTPKRLGTNSLEPRLVVPRPRTQIQRSLNTPTASRIRRKSKSPSISVPIHHTKMVKRFKNKLLGAELQPSQAQHSKQPTYEQILSSVRPRILTVPITPKLATMARCNNRKKATVVETLAKTVKNKAVPAVAAGIGHTRLTVTVPQPFMLSTQVRAGKREQLKLTKRHKEAVAKEEKRLDDERKEKEEQEELVKVRKGLVHRAQPVRNYKPPSHRAHPPPATAVQPKPSKNIPAPPPPPPPLPRAATPPPQSLLSQMTAVVSAPPTPSLPHVDNTRGNLMGEIRKGGSLRHVSPERKTKAVVDTRGELMGQIRLGVALKKVDSDGGQEGPLVQQTAPRIAGMLQSALQERVMVMGMSSSENEDSGEDDGEWDN